MKKNLFASYINGIRDQEVGQSYCTILSYFLPELITSLILYSFVNIIDSWFIAHLQNTVMYATQGVTNTVIHFLIKVAEALSIATVITCGHHNGVGDYKKVGKSAINAFWLTATVGFLIALFLYTAAYWIYWLYGVEPQMIVLGVSFLRIKAVGIFFMFLYFSVIGFLRSIKDTKTPMVLFSIGSILFIALDYALIYGKFGLPELQLRGSAIASVAQYALMLIGAIIYLAQTTTLRPYAISLRQLPDWPSICQLINLSWPIICDKGSLAGAKIWLGMMIAPLGIQAIASSTIIEVMERLAFIPAIAFSQVITLLVSNDYKKANWVSIKNNIKKIIFLASLMVFSILCIFSIWPYTVIQLFDKRGIFATFAASAFPYLTVFVFFDLLQLILSGGLRGIAEVRTVMWTRVAVCLVCFAPASYLIAHYGPHNVLAKFIMLYISFYVASGLMSIIYIRKFRHFPHAIASELAPLGS
ncbi:MAG TPA: MATE family efflux transporter [Candidatus Babeliaceae bacterium]|nr:MATE family efflux transporter [Candidatus Babeliaceae bacterium]